MTGHSNVCPREPLSKDKFQVILAAAWSRVASDLGSQSAMAARMGLNDSKTISRATGVNNLPEAHTVFNSLCADKTALREILAHYGLELCVMRPDAANDLATSAGVIAAMGKLVEANTDGHRDHTETLAIADLLRSHMPAVVAILREADELRGAA